MAGAIVQTGYNVDDSGASSTTISVTLTGVAAGNHIVAFVGWEDGGSTSATVSDGTAFSNAGAKVRDTGNGQSSEVFYRENVGSGSHTITATFSVTEQFRRIRVAEVSGLATSSSLDQATGQYQGSPGTGANGVSSSASSATTNANDFVMGFTQDTGEGDPGSGTLTAGTGYTITGTNVIMGLESKSVAATGAQTATFTQSVNNSRTTHVAAFKEAAGGGGTTTTKTMSDTLVMSDAALDSVQRVRQMSDTTSVSDEAVRLKLLPRTTSDSLTLTDSVIDWVRRVRVAEDALALIDDTTRYLRFVRRTDEAIALADAVIRSVAGSGLVVTKVMSDGVTLADDAGQRWTLRVRQTSDTINPTDVLIRTALRVRVLGDAPVIDDGAVRVTRLRRTATDTLDVPDEMLKTLQLDQLSPTAFRFGAGELPFLFGAGELPFTFGAS